MNSNKLGVIFVTTIQIPSISCALYIFFRSSQRTSPLRRLRNHLLICLLIAATWTTIIELPHTQKYLWSDSVSISTPSFCVFWNISFLCSPALNRLFMAFMSIERHFLVFRPQLYHTQHSRLLFHYIPIIIIMLVTLIYVFGTNIFVSCSQLRFDYSRFMCGYTCSVLINNLGTFYTWIFVFMPTTITIIGCILLPIRFVIQKRQLQRVQWHRARKMIVQMSLIAGTYTICWLPYTIILQLSINNIIPFSNPDINRFTAFAPYVTSLLTPFLIIHIVREQLNLKILEQIKRWFSPQRQTAIRPIVTVVAEKENNVAIEEHNSTGK